VCWLLGAHFSQELLSKTSVSLSINSVPGPRQPQANVALQDVRRSVSVLRTPREPFACTRGITLLVEQLREHGLSVDFEVDGSEERFSNEALMTLYRVAQEGFTNIQKHAQASAVQVSLHFAEEEASLSICDNGRGFDTQHGPQPPERPGEGYGLQGIRERLALVGGSFQLVSREVSGVQPLVTVTRTGIPTSLYRDSLQQSEKASQGDLALPREKVVSDDKPG
jgi:signal transduction histidine kinase